MHMPISIKLALAGLGPLALHWGIGVALIIAIVLIELFAGAIGGAIPLVAPLLTRFRKDLLWLAIAIAIFLFAESMGVKDEAHRCAAQSAVVQTTVDNAVAAARHPTADQLRNDRWDSPSAP
jgi:hypothetical protein